MAKNLISVLGIGMLGLALSCAPRRADNAGNQPEYEYTNMGKYAHLVNIRGTAQSGDLQRKLSGIARKYEVEYTAISDKKNGLVTVIRYYSTNMIEAKKMYSLTMETKDSTDKK